MNKARVISSNQHQNEKTIIFKTTNKQLPYFVLITYYDPKSKTGFSETCIYKSDKQGNVSDYQELAYRAGSQEDYKPLDVVSLLGYEVTNLWFYQYCLEPLDYLLENISNSDERFETHKEMLAKSVNNVDDLAEIGFNIEGDYVTGKLSKYEYKYLTELETVIENKYYLSRYKPEELKKCVCGRYHGTKKELQDI